MDIDYLSHHTEHMKTVADWVYNEFVVNSPRTASYERVLSNFQNTFDDRLPVTYVAVIDGICAGTVSIVTNDLKTQTARSPWLAAVFVRPAYRNRGLAAVLISRAHEDARRFGFSELYLRTEHAAPYYKRLGWEAVCEAADEYGIQTLVMKYTL